MPHSAYSGSELLVWRIAVLDRRRYDVLITFYGTYQDKTLMYDAPIDRGRGLIICVRLTAEEVRNISGIFQDIRFLSTEDVRSALQLVDDTSNTIFDLCYFC